MTIFSIPKPFVGHIATIQENAISSWRGLGDCEVVLLGDEAGVSEAAMEFGCVHISAVAKNEFGTPLLNSAFELAKNASSAQYLAYVNADIILLPDFLMAIQHLHGRRALMVGRRWDLDVEEKWRFTGPEAFSSALEAVRRRGVLHGPTGSDYFVFRRNDPIAVLPPFAVGRPAWDNWMIRNARASGVAVIDASSSVVAIHQNHDYAHMGSTGLPKWEGPEADRNREFAGGYDALLTLLDCTHAMKGSKVIPIMTLSALIRRISTYRLLRRLQPSVPK